jgi:hypothetical protein
MKRAYSVSNIITARFRALELEGEWASAIGTPEIGGTWFIYGAPKNGKTSFAMKLAKYLSGFRRVAYNSIEEGFSLSIRRALERAEMLEAGQRVVLVNQNAEELAAYLRHHKSPDIVIIDSVQFMGLTFGDYRRLKKSFPHKLFIYISHVEGKVPDGLTARKIFRDASVTFRIEGFKAFTSSRYGDRDNAEIIIAKDRAEAYWGDRQL